MASLKYDSTVATGSGSRRCRSRRPYRIRRSLHCPRSHSSGAPGATISASHSRAAPSTRRGRSTRSSSTRRPDVSGSLTLKAPLSGWVMPLAEVPDPVFADGMMGEGVAIDPTDDLLRAPCDGEIVSVATTAHAVTLRAANGAELLLHVGI